MIQAVRILSFVAACSLLSSCQNGQNPFQKTGGNDPYASNYGNDGGYNPYPGQAGYAQSGGGYSSAPSYTPPPAPVEADPYAFHGGSSSPAPKPSYSSGSSSTKKKVASSSSKPKPKSSTKKSGGSYKVAKGDTLYGIARKRGTTVAKIKSANSLSSDVIRPGQSLRIP